ncbi:DEAD/DEAH box helicase [Sedimentibacter sp. B4]|uniref:DEAD/DEAH box helicase n=1 Tax=Sedimentibacter sp. B4 TaxID=304766 RepID=UPI00031EBF5C|nr:DEAD/DEAH box helicase [Sedimentibacter sp. B4]
MKFENLNVIEPILKALSDEGYEAPSPIQEQSIPSVLEGRDLLGCAQTGTGKTAAFAVPIIQKIYTQKNKGSKRQVQSLILTPTRELAVQIEDNFRAYGKYTGLKYLSIFGGVSQNPQTDALRRGVDVLIATPGRLMDLINQRQVNLQNVKVFVLDEADRMLDMGFIHDVKKIISYIPQERQTLFFSATMPREISDLVNSILSDPVKVAVAPVSSTVDTIEQSVYFVDKNNKKKLLVDLLNSDEISSALVFTRTKYDADKVVKELAANKINSLAIHGDKSQNARQNALNSFKKGEIKVLVATDIAARGIDINELSHVINFNLPNLPETYVHRIGRTGRAGMSGTAISFCEYEEKPFLKDIQKLIKKNIEVVKDHPYPMLINCVVPKAEKKVNRQKVERIETEISRSRKSASKGSSYRGNSNKGSSSKGNSKKSYARSGK